MADAKKLEDTQTLRENEKKWGKDAVAVGWTLVPNILLLKQHALGLDPVDINITGGRPTSTPIPVRDD